MELQLLVVRQMDACEYGSCWTVSSFLSLRATYVALRVSYREPRPLHHATDRVERSALQLETILLNCCYGDNGSNTAAVHFNYTIKLCCVYSCVLLYVQ